MSFNLGVMNAAVALDDSAPNAKLKQFPVTAENSFKKLPGMLYEFDCRGTV